MHVSKRIIYYLIVCRFEKKTYKQLTNSLHRTLETLKHSDELAKAFGTVATIDIHVHGDEKKFKEQERDRVIGGERGDTSRARLSGLP